MKTMKRIGGLLVIAALGGLMALGIERLLEKERPKSFEQMQNAWFTGNKNLGANPGIDFVAVSELATPAVVHIKTIVESSAKSQQVPEGMFDPFEFFNDPRLRGGPQEASGSGVIISQDGYIVTNNHVIDNATKIEVVLDDKRTYIAELVGKDPETDLALLKITEKELSFLKFGNSDNLKVGEWVIAVGNPFNLTSTVTAGIVSAKGRNINLLRQNSEWAIENFIQTDAAVNPGNSGGALVSIGGDLIGINTAIASQTGSYTGYSFAIPINLAKKVLDDLLKYGEVKRAVLGVKIQDITAELADEKGIKEIKGVYVPELVEGSAAEKGGVKAGDVILKINEQEVNSASQLQEHISKYYPGDKIKLLISRENKNKELDVILRSRDGKTEIETTIKREDKTVLGVTVENLSRDEKIKLKVKNGVRIKKLGNGAFKDGGVPEGFVITHIDKKPVYASNDVEQMLKDKEGAVLLEGLMPNGTKEAFALKVRK
jgi:Do/DeqQ family serine protease